MEGERRVGERGRRWEAAPARALRAGRRRIDTRVRGRDRHARGRKGSRAWDGGRKRGGGRGT